MAEQERDRGDAAAFIRDAPANVHMALLCRLSPKWILRMRSVCKAWRDMLHQGALLYLLHRLQPPQLLICFGHAACPDHYIQLRDYCVGSLDLRSGERRPVFHFIDNEYYDMVGNVEGRDAPPIVALSVDYKRMEESYAEHIDLRPQLVVHASLDGYLLVSFLERWYVINPATRDWVAVPDLINTEVIGFYEHATSGEYRVLCISNICLVKDDADNYFEVQGSLADYGVLTVSSVQLRSIRRPISSAAPKDHGLRFGVDMCCISPPIQLKRNQHLHWPPQKRQGYHILVFDTEKEEFSWKRPPPGVVSQDVSLLEFPTGHLGVSVTISRDNFISTELWCLRDYEGQVWDFVYRIPLPVQEMPVLQHEQFWVLAVVSPEGDVLIQSPHWLLHCDRNGTLLRKFCLPEEVLTVKHLLRENLHQHRMFRAPKVEGATEPLFFNWLCSDPSW